MDLIEIDRCESTEPWYGIRVDSASEEGKTYEVLIPMPFTKSEEFICECAGYVYKGHCRHQSLAAAKLCRWNGLDGPEEQTADQKKNFVCPRCSEGTIRSLELE